MLMVCHLSCFSRHLSTAFESKVRRQRKTMGRRGFIRLLLLPERRENTTREIYRSLWTRQRLFMCVRLYVRLSVRVCVFLRLSDCVSVYGYQESVCIVIISIGMCV